MNRSVSQSLSYWSTICRNSWNCYECWIRDSINGNVSHNFKLWKLSNLTYVGTIKRISDQIFLFYYYVSTPSEFRWSCMCNCVMIRRWKILKRVKICKLNLLPGVCRVFEPTAFRIGAARFAAVLTSHTMLPRLIKVTSRKKYFKKKKIRVTFLSQ